MQLFPHAFPFVQILQHSSVVSTDHSIADPSAPVTRAGEELAVVVLRTKSAVNANTRATTIIRPRYALTQRARKGHRSAPAK
jgi:hypothetical protein